MCERVRACACAVDPLLVPGSADAQHILLGCISERALPVLVRLFLSAIDACVALSLNVSGVSLHPHGRTDASGNVCCRSAQVLTKSCVQHLFTFVALFGCVCCQCPRAFRYLALWRRVAVRPGVPRGAGWSVFESVSSMSCEGSWFVVQRLAAPVSARVPGLFVSALLNRLWHADVQQHPTTEKRSHVSMESPNMVLVVACVVVSAQEHYLK